jgi:hypothetical protein
MYGRNVSPADALKHTLTHWSVFYHALLDYNRTLCHIVWQVITELFDRNFLSRYVKRN